jgi:hypothetical protein
LVVFAKGKSHSEFTVEIALSSSDFRLLSEWGLQDSLAVLKVNRGHNFGWLKWDYLS